MKTFEMLRLLTRHGFAKCLEKQELNDGVYLTEDGVVWSNTGESLTLNSCTIEYEWLIEKKYVDFNEALKALKNGYSILSYYKEDLCNKYFPYNKFKSIPIVEILDCKWVIGNFEGNFRHFPDSYNTMTCD
ncbi:hypothetical protein ACFVR2_02000 [Gottfriedia sp. NPDC057991]|uniref:hypothetical protein n=1 Tax=Gottfriedia sp. NPDC057991 TaxID=3346298 RepID=UPI0036DB90E3